jgi:hypothetical protein
LVLPARFNVWHLTPAFAETARLTDAHEVTRRVYEGIRQPYPVVAEVEPGICIHRNADARALATLVREVRPADSDLDAARQILTPGRPVRELTYAVAPGGRSADLSLEGPRYFAGGTAEICADRPDDIRVTTTTAGEGFLVLAVTRCVGWTATIDGEEAPIHAVDGPFMGVCVPPGEHEVRFRYRPLLVWVGTAAALTALGGAWLGVLFGTVLRAARGSCRRRPGSATERGSINSTCAVWSGGEGAA